MLWFRDREENIQHVFKLVFPLDSTLCFYFAAPSGTFKFTDTVDHDIANIHYSRQGSHSTGSPLVSWEKF